MDQNKQELPDEQYKEPDFSSVTIGAGTSLEREREIKIVEFLSTQFGTTSITTAELENNEGFMLSVENTPGSGKALK